MMLTYDEVLERLPAYVLGALEPDEAAAMDEYMEAQRALMQRLAQADAATILLVHGTAPAPMRADAKSRLMARIEADARSHAGESAAATPAPAAFHTGIPEASGMANEATLPAAQSGMRSAAPAVRTAIDANDDIAPWLHRLFRVRTLWNALAVASMVALLVLAVAEARHFTRLNQAYAALQATQAENAAYQQRNEDLAEANLALQADNSELQGQINQLAQANAALLAQQEQLETELNLVVDRVNLMGSANDAAILFGTEQSPDLQGAFYLSGQNGMLVVHGLEPLPAEQAYQFWLVTPQGEQIPAGTFAVHENQEPTWATISLPQNPPPFAAVGVSIEPSSGSSQPTGPMLMESESS
jgi:anti-sigma-K factor RskA